MYYIPGITVVYYKKSVLYKNDLLTSYIYTDTEKSVTKQKYNTEKKEQKTI